MNCQNIKRFFYLVLGTVVFFLGYCPKVMAGRLKITMNSEYVEHTSTDEDGQTTKSTNFKYGSVNLKLNIPSGWMFDSSLLRPQLLLVSSPNFQEPSRLHIEFLGTAVSGNGSMMDVESISPGSVVTKYVAPVWKPLTGGICDGKNLWGFQKIKLEKGDYREEIYIKQVAVHYGIKVRITFSPKITPQEESEIRRTLESIKVTTGKEMVTESKPVVSKPIVEKIVQPAVPPPEEPVSGSDRSISSTENSVDSPPATNALQSEAEVEKVKIRSELEAYEGSDLTREVGRLQPSVVLYVLEQIDEATRVMYEPGGGRQKSVWVRTADLNSVSRKVRKSM